MMQTGKVAMAINGHYYTGPHKTAKWLTAL